MKIVSKDEYLNTLTELAKDNNNIFFKQNITEITALKYAINYGSNYDSERLILRSASSEYKIGYMLYVNDVDYKLMIDNYLVPFGFAIDDDYGKYLKYNLNDLIEIFKYRGIKYNEMIKMFSDKVVKIYKNHGIDIESIIYQKAISSVMV